MRHLIEAFPTAILLTAFEVALVYPLLRKAMRDAD